MNAVKIAVKIFKSKESPWKIRDFLLFSIVVYFRNSKFKQNKANRKKINRTALIKPKCKQIRIEYCPADQQSAGTELFFSLARIPIGARLAQYKFYHEISLTMR